MSTVAKRTLQKAALLAIAGTFQKGCYGRIRFQKVAYFAQRNSDKKFFSFKIWYHGQYSEEITALLRELRDTGTLGPGSEQEPCPIYQVASASLYSGALKIVAAVFPDFLDCIKTTVKSVGYLEEEVLLRLACQLPEMQKTAHGDILETGNLPDEVSLNLDTDILEDFALTVNPKFTMPLRTLIKGLDSVSLEPKVRDFIFNA